jgi:biofilm PGA synthesis N-glycosyltransferase PgaC
VTVANHAPHRARAPHHSPAEPTLELAPAPLRPRLYLRVRSKVVISMLVGAGWLGLSVWLAWPWISELADHVALVPALTIVALIALIPGYLNAHLLTAVLLDRPPPLRLDAARFPPITVLIAAYNEEDSIAETLASVLGSDYPGPVRVLVIDDGSIDATAQVVSGIADADRRVRLINKRHAGKAAALRRGLAEAVTPLLATLDADTVLAPESLRRAVARLQASPPGTAAVAGAVLVRNPSANLLTAAQQWDYYLGIASVKRVQALFQGTLVAQGAFSVYRSFALRTVGGWPDTIGEDIVLTWALLREGWKTTFEPTALAFTTVPRSLRAFLRQRRRWARGMIEALRQHGWPILRGHRLAARGVFVDLLLPLIDAVFTLAFVPGVVLALFGNFMLVGPMTLAVVPLGLLAGLIMACKQRRSLADVGIGRVTIPFGFGVYLLLYQFLISPVALIGYLQELARRPKKW